MAPAPAGAVRLHELSHELADEISLQMYPAAKDRSTQGGRREGMRDQRDLHQTPARQGVDGQADPIDSDGPVQHAQLSHIRWRFDIEQHRLLPLSGPRPPACLVPAAS